MHLLERGQMVAILIKQLPQQLDDESGLSTAQKARRDGMVNIQTESLPPLETLMLNNLFTLHGLNLIDVPTRCFCYLHL